MTEWVLDLFGGAGGAARGYQLAGYKVRSVDIVEQPRSCADDVWTADAVEFLARNLYRGLVRNYSLVHLSPPCQAACALTVGTNAATKGGNHADLIPVLRPLLYMLGLAGVPYVIEQPTGKAPIRKDITLCGEMFGLGVIRHRNFELSGWGWDVIQPAHPSHRGPVRGWRHGVYRDGPYVAAYGEGGGKASVAEMQEAMGINWTDNRRELTEAIPPAYTEWLGNQFRKERPIL